MRLLHLLHICVQYVPYASQRTLCGSVHLRMKLSPNSPRRRFRRTIGGSTDASMMRRRSDGVSGGGGRGFTNVRTTRVSAGRGVWQEGGKSSDTRGDEGDAAGDDAASLLLLLLLADELKGPAAAACHPAMICVCMSSAWCRPREVRCAIEARRIILLRGLHRQADRGEGRQHQTVLTMQRSAISGPRCGCSSSPLLSFMTKNELHLWSVRLTARNFETFCGAFSPDPSVLEQCKRATKIEFNIASRQQLCSRLFS